MRDGSLCGLELLECFAHDPFEVYLISDGKAVFANFFKAVFLVKPDGTRVFAEDADVDFVSVNRPKVVHGPLHESVTESLAQE